MKRYAANIAENQKIWKDIYENGANDPFYADGVNLNLVRNHIIYYKRRCEEELKPEEYPSEYYLEVPPVVDEKYIANPDQIREKAKQSLETYLQDRDYQYLKKMYHKLNEKQKKDVCINNVLNYVTGLKHSICDDNLVAMRRHRNTETYLESFRSCRKKVEAILGDGKILPVGQLSLFDLFEI